MSRPDVALENIRLLAIGGSAGGVEALLKLAALLPAGCAASVVVAMHLLPSRPSLLPKLLAECCALPVREAEDKEPLLPGTVYLAPPNYHLMVDNAPPQICLSVDPPVHFSRPSIDVLFESCAEAFGPRVMGLLLSGANNDGAAGLQAIARSGGITAVQSPADARVPTMPAAALAGGFVRYALPAAGFGPVFSVLAAHSETRESACSNG